MQHLPRVLGAKHHSTLSTLARSGKLCNRLNHCATVSRRYFNACPFRQAMQRTTKRKKGLTALLSTLARSGKLCNSHIKCGLRLIKLSTLARSDKLCNSPSNSIPGKIVSFQCSPVQASYATLHNTISQSVL